jgi:hypothetical protein
VDTAAKETPIVFLPLLQLERTGRLLSGRLAADERSAIER